MNSYLRYEPKTDAPILEELVAGQVIGVAILLDYNSVGDWLRVYTSETSDGWVPRSYILIEEWCDVLSCHTKPLGKREGCNDELARRTCFVKIRRDYCPFGANLAHLPSALWKGDELYLSQTSRTSKDGI